MAPLSTGFSDNSEDVTPNCDGGVRKVVLRPSNDLNGFLPQTGDTVKVHYTGYFEDGNQFTSSRENNQPRTFVLGQGEVLKGWEIGVSTMKLGEVSVFRCTPFYAYGTTGMLPIISPNVRVFFELELLSFEGEDISKTKDGGVRKTILVRGSDEDGSPYDNALCTISYSCQLFSKPSHVVTKQDVITFTLGEGCDFGLTPAMERSLKKMKRGEKSRLKILSRHAYGLKGNEKLGVPPDSDLLCCVELHDFVQARQHWEMSRKELLENSNLEKEKAAHNFSLGKFYMAKKKFRRSRLLAESITFSIEEIEAMDSYCPHLPETIDPNDTDELAKLTIIDVEPDPGTTEPDPGTTEPDPDTTDLEVAQPNEGEGKLSGQSIEDLLLLREKKFQLVLAGNLNLSLCHLKMGNNLRAYTFAENALQMEPRNVKALYRRGMAYYNMGNFEDAKENMELVLELHPSNKAALKHWKLCKEKVRDQVRKDKSVYNGMFKKFFFQDLQRQEDYSSRKDVFSGIGEWDNKMADGMMTLEQEMAAFGETMPERGYDKENDNPGSDED